MNKKHWGPIIWKLIHCLTYKIKDEYFSGQLNFITSTIRNICASLPCPYCAAHAQSFLRKVNFEKIKTKDDLINLFLTFHNHVNKRLKKKTYTREECDKIYNNISFMEVINDYHLYTTNTKSGTKAMLNTFHMKRTNNNFISKIAKQLYKYNNLN